MDDITAKNLEEIQIKKTNEQILREQTAKTKNKKKVTSNVQINPKIKSIADICSHNEQKNRNRWIEDLILQRAKDKHNIVLPDFEARVTNDNSN